MGPCIITQLSSHLYRDTDGLLTTPAYRMCRSQNSALGGLLNVGATVHLQESITFGQCLKLPKPSPQLAHIVHRNELSPTGKPMVASFAP